MKAQPKFLKNFIELTHIKKKGKYTEYWSGKENLIMKYNIYLVNYLGRL